MFDSTFVEVPNFLILIADLIRIFCPGTILTLIGLFFLVRFTERYAEKWQNRQKTDR
jgi:hypothetical protein